MPTSNKPLDPFAQREAERYANPIASREMILDMLAVVGRPLSRSELAKRLKLHSEDEEEALRRRLRAMERDGQVMCTRKGLYGLVSNMDLIKGRVLAHRDGFGFVRREGGGGDDIYLSSRQMVRVFDGDEVLVRVDSIDFKGRAEGVIVEVLARNTSQVVGRLARQGGIQFVVPENPRINHDVQLPQGAEGSAQPGQIVVVEITEQPERRRKPVGRVIETLGDAMDPGLEIEIALRSHDLPWQWPQDALDEAAQLGEQVRPADKSHRVDLRDLDLVTIDGEDARDFDDAVYCMPLRTGGWRLWVAIADVSSYVQVGSALDSEAQLRGTSVYFPERVIPMLPEALSNGLCSLNPEVDRLCMVCEMRVGRKGKVGSYRFFEGVMRSKARLTYNEVGRFLQGDEAEAVPAPVRKPLKNLYKLYQALRKARDARGAIDFDTEETRIVFGDNRKIEKIVPVYRGDAHKLIEECMLAANVCAADFLAELKLPALYRVHEGPRAEKLENLRRYLGELGLSLGGGDDPEPGNYQVLLEQIAGRPDAHIIQTMMLRSMNQAVYQPQNLGHFGLHYEAYAHFTSPIRRYPDLLVHRAIRSVIHSNAKTARVERVAGAEKMDAGGIYPYDVKRMVALGEHCSMTERRADDATRDVVAWLKCEYLHERIGEEFDAVVASVTSFGLFVELVDVYIEGLVHVTSLPRDYYHFDIARQRLVGERTGASWQLGGRLRVRLVRVDLDDRKIDLEPVSAGAVDDAPRIPRKRKKKRVRSNDG